VAALPSRQWIASLKSSTPSADDVVTPAGSCRTIVRNVTLDQAAYAVDDGDVADTNLGF
jgi:hypothetical protein